MTGVSEIPRVKLQVVGGSAMTRHFESTERREWSPLQTMAVRMLTTVDVPQWKDLEVSLREYTKIRPDGKILDGLICAGQVRTTHN